MLIGKSTGMCAVVAAVNFITLLLMCNGAMAQNIVINELFARADDTTPEWIELFNTEKRARNLTGLLVADNSSKKGIPDFRIDAESYIVLCVDSSLMRLRYDLPEHIDLLEVKLPSLNNGGDELRLFNSKGERLDSVSYTSTQVLAAVSLERREAGLDGFSTDNWAFSVHPDGATPGRRNSTTPVDIDLVCSSVVSQEKHVVLKCLNAGKTDLENISVRVDIQNDGRTAFTADSSLTLLAASDSARFVFNHSLSTSGWYSCVATASAEGDERPGNDSITSTLYMDAGRDNILISEIMFRPLPGQAEYVELHNAGNDSTDIRSWRLIHSAKGGVADSLVFAIPSYCEQGVCIAPEGVLAVCWNTALFAQFPGLNECRNALFVDQAFNLRSGGGTLMLANPNGRIVDSLCFSPNLHLVPLSAQQGRSLERDIRSGTPQFERDWTTSADERGGSAGESNRTSDIPARASIEIQPNPLLLGESPAITHISYRVPFSHSFVRVQIFDSEGRQVATLLDAQFSAAHGSAEWDGRDDRGAQVNPGVYIVQVEAAAYTAGEVHCEADLLLVGR